MANNRIEWTIDMDRRLIALREMDVSMRDCAQRLGVSYLPVQTRCRELGINHRPEHKRKQAQILKLRRQGLSYSQIAKAAKVSKAVVAGVINRRKTS